MTDILAGEAPLLSSAPVSDSHRPPPGCAARLITNLWNNHF